MGLPAAINFVLIGLALIFLDKKIGNDHRPSQYLALLAGFFSILAIMGYAYNVPSLYYVGKFTGIAIYAAIAFLFLFLGILFCRPNEGLMRTFNTDLLGGKITPLILLPTILITLILGWIIVQGMNMGFYPGTFAISSLVISTIIISFILIWLFAIRLNLFDADIRDTAQRLKDSKDYNRNLIETALDPLVTIGSDGKITDVNKATELVTGYSREELVGTDFADYFTNPVEAKAGYQQVFQQGIVRDYPLEIKHKYGSITPVLYNASVYKDEFGEVIGVFAAARDITERKEAEKQLRKYRDNLEEQVELRTEELAKSNADLKQFAYVASHDLREPLRMITSFLQLLERRYKDQLDEDANKFIGFAVDGAKRLDIMIMDLLEYSRVANHETQFTDVNLEQVIDRILTNLSILIDENSAHITYDSLPTIQSDENLMVRLFQNLIENAIKYRSEETPQIHVSAEKDDNQYVFSVKDNGIGIDPQHLERIFTIFKRLHPHEIYEGTGIGLAIAHRIVHQHGGEIWAESQPGKGTTFHFNVPIL
jgi:PAS domain S-box-containing protein